jgi:hypothetical protein
MLKTRCGASLFEHAIILTGAACLLLAVPKVKYNTNYLHNFKLFSVTITTAGLISAISRSFSQACLLQSSPFSLYLLCIVLEVPGHPYLFSPNKLSNSFVNCFCCNCQIGLKPVVLLTGSKLVDRYVTVDKLAFLGNSDCNASKFLPNLYDGAKCMSNKGKQTDSG